MSVEVDEEANEEDFLKQIDDFIAAGGKEDYDSAFSLLRQKEKKVMNQISCEYTCILSNCASPEMACWNSLFIIEKTVSEVEEWHQKMKCVTLEILIRTSLPGRSVMCNFHEPDSHGYK